ncbi:DNA-binding transcriptional regulator YhcF (GntR family) [Virgibacillus natechei]|uniref:DNA-binding transcriptional regulator YhcF (GntR family) n=1 Tax=Virgibacillus natechei TaxID=1216297 RepID=A0ABS4IC18_9BACI|nr:anti-repressor SinI family protein [Virgibacillus natechei]MBP1968006.1 DNA-binding transcriptional regulator YhcF (GntR family) [Virgibacillus natechei]UZD14711.1 anti-repressor SinI family protein [Virgibacillus natechei]
MNNQEWTELIKEAKNLGLTKEEISHFLKREGGLR